MNIFDIRNQLVEDYGSYIGSFIRTRDKRVTDYVEESFANGLLWPEPLIQLNPSFEPAERIDELVGQGILHEECDRVFRFKDEDSAPGAPLRLHKHQSEAIKTARGGQNYVLTTGTGSGKSLAYIVPIVDHVLRRGSGKGIQAIIVYPMNALANSQFGELEKFLCLGYPDKKGPVTFRQYTGQESNEEKRQIRADPPDILLTNYVMLELILTRPDEKPLIRAASDLRFLVFDELHTYRGRQGADVSLLIRRVRDAMGSDELQCVGTSATLAGSGTAEERKKDVAEVASKIFGVRVKPEHVIGETLKRLTPETDLSGTSFLQSLKARISDPSVSPPTSFSEFTSDPLSIWLEGTFGLMLEVDSGVLLRAKPKTINGADGAARLLEDATGIEEKQCAAQIEKGLLGGYECEPNPDTGRPPFAFRLHQFISRGDTVYASVEDESSRYITTEGQKYVPGDRSKVLLPLVFCRECGQEYYAVRSHRDQDTGKTVFEPRELRDQVSDEESESGFLYLSGVKPWPTKAKDVIDRLPDDWLDSSGNISKIRKDRQGHLPKPIRLGKDGREAEDGLECHHFSTPFRFCLHCGVAYNFRQRSDMGKLTSLGVGGRSTATTILALSMIRSLKMTDLPSKLLSFTDNRQDASLQAGHFNDFVEIGLLRAALFGAVESAGPHGISHEDLTQLVFDKLVLPLELYASDPTVRYQALEETNKALRHVLGYRLYRDLKRGWRVTSPNLEQCGLLEIRYKSLDELCRDQEIWDVHHPALASASPETREKIAKVLLDFMRRELAIKVDYLDRRVQEGIQQQSSQRLIDPWAIDENERTEHAALLLPRARRRQDYRGNVFLSARGGFGQYLGRNATFPEYAQKLDLTDRQLVCEQLLEALRVAGLVEIAQEATADDVAGYQLPASAILWAAGDGGRSFNDPIRVPQESDIGSQSNTFFVEFYRTVAGGLQGMQAREHTAQVPSDSRIQRENDFRAGRLPILFCSPTMELGVDISELNAVNLRNMPPTPANYAQRSGRAGRQGQPALIFSYCASGSPHDQYFFKRPEEMVAGEVAPPRLDLANEDLVRAHVHAIWLAETGQSLGRTLGDILDLAGDPDALALQDVVRDSISENNPKQRALTRARNVLASMEGDLRESPWFTDGWLDDAMAQIERQFDRTCERWRELYRAAHKQATIQTGIILDASRSLDEKKQAKRLRAEAEAQLRLLSDVGNVVQSDFYSYRYFASEGFLPGYSFPRLPLSAFIPARRARQRDEYLSRPRFLAISEFGPRAVVYHEGSRYEINRVILPVGEEDILTQKAKHCPECGYIHPMVDETGPDLCERCGVLLDQPLQPLLRLQNVTTRRRDKINSDEEERLRLGYELKTGVRFTEHKGGAATQEADIVVKGKKIAKVTYGQAATIWRINLGWSRRDNKNLHGFVLDTERGYWAKSEKTEDEDNVDDPMSAVTKRVIPYVEDRRNCLILEPSETLGHEQMASLQAALKNAIQVQYQLEDQELAVEPLPNREDRRLLLFFEAAEGGAGVLRRLVEDPKAFPLLADQALRICHFDPQSGADLRRAPRAREDCEAACYNCLMEYANQMDHRLLDRHAVKDFLVELSKANVSAAPVGKSRIEHMGELMRLCGSNLERDWLKFLDDRDGSLPSRAQFLIESCGTQPDFFYDDRQVAVYIDGSHHEYSERQERDQEKTELLEDKGYTVVRFGLKDDWGQILARYPHVFGSSS